MESVDENLGQTWIPKPGPHAGNKWGVSPHWLHLRGVVAHADLGSRLRHPFGTQE